MATTHRPPRLARIDPSAPLWVFGYGSLLWNPGFHVAERVTARLEGYHRSFCMRSIHHRGTEVAPGLVLALDAFDGASCQGVAFRVEPGAEAETLAGLRARELISSAYAERIEVLLAEDGRSLSALAYVIERDHPQYAADLTLEAQARIIAVAEGGRGTNADYLTNTVEHLVELGLEDPDLAWLAARVREIRSKTR